MITDPIVEVLDHETLTQAKADALAIVTSAAKVPEHLIVFSQIEHYNVARYREDVVKHLRN